MLVAAQLDACEVELARLEDTANEELVDCAREELVRLDDTARVEEIVEGAREEDRELL